MKKNAIILAAGKSNRFAPFTYEKPKGLFRVKNEILIERQIEQLHAAGVFEIYVVIGYMKEKFFYLEQKYIKFTVPSSAKEKALRFSTGLLSIILLMLIFELTIKKFLIGEIISYFLLILWITAGYPALFEHLSEK